MGSPHLTPDQITRLAAGDSVDADGEIRAHMTECRECRDAVNESALWHATWTSQPKAFANALEASRASARFLRKTGDRRRWTWSRRRRLALAGSGFALAAVLAFLLWRPGERLPFPIEPVTAAIEESALTGRVLIPGAEKARLVDRGAYRSGFASPSDEVDAVLHRMADAYIARPTNADLAARLVAGYLATGQMRSARDFARDARRRFPDDRRFLVLQGLVSYCEGRMEEAEGLLRSALSRDRDDAVAMVNLAQLLSETGRREEAVSLARSVRRAAGSDVLIARADSILAGARS